MSSRTRDPSASSAARTESSTFSVSENEPNLQGAINLILENAKLAFSFAYTQHRSHSKSPDKVPLKVIVYGDDTGPRVTHNAAVLWQKVNQQWEPFMVGGDASTVCEAVMELLETSSLALGWLHLEQEYFCVRDLKAAKPKSLGNSRLVYSRCIDQ